MKKESSGRRPTGRTFIVEFEGKRYKRKEYRREFVKDPIFCINKTYWHIPESKIIKEVNNEY